MNSKKTYVDRETKAKILSFYENGDSLEDIATEIERPVTVVRNVLQKNEVYDTPITKTYMKKNGKRWDDTCMMVRKAAGWC